MLLDLFDWISSGDVVLENLELKEDALNSFNVPFSVKKGSNYLYSNTLMKIGFIGKIQLKIPWKNLKGQPVIVIVHNVYIVAQPQYSYAEVPNWFTIFFLLTDSSTTVNVNDSLLSKQRKQS